jgi:glycosyltransferase involved in cell wall biosynthesis
VRLAVFTSKYPARVATFFERDMQALLRAGVDLEIFSIYPRDDALWPQSLDAQLGDGRLRERTHYLAVGSTLAGAMGTGARRPLACARQAATVLAASVRYGPVAVAKSAYVLPKAWSWAASRATEFDHVLAYWGNYAGTCAWAFHQLVGRPVPFSIWLHAGTDLYHQPIHLRAKLLHADNILTCCEFNATYIARAFADIHERIRSRVHVCHHGLDLREYPFTREARPASRIVAVGRLSPYKGFEYLLRAIATLRTRSRAFHLDVVGGGELATSLAALSAELGVSDSVRFHGWVDHPVARRLMQQATVLVHPSDGLGDGLPNVVREAMALGTPVIGSDAAGLPDALADGCGLLVPPRDHEALADTLERVFDAPALADRMAHAARRRVEEHYDLWRNGNRLAALLAGTRRPGSATPIHSPAPPQERLRCTTP